MCHQLEPGPSESVWTPHRTVRAFSIVSAVVKVLDTTTAMVVAGSRPFRARATSTGSTLARKRSVRPLDSLAEFCGAGSRLSGQRGPRIQQ
jgi:hypothetical protein